MKHIKVKKCRYCGGTEFAKGIQDTHGCIRGQNVWDYGQTLYHVVCLDCGCVVQTYVKEPERLLSRKRRKENEASEEDT